MCRLPVCFPVSIPIPWCVSRCPSVSLSFSPRVTALVFLSRFFDHVTWRRSPFLSRVHFSRETSTSTKFSFLPSSFPSRPFVFRFNITCSGKSGGIFPTFRFSFPCPVNELSGKE